MKFVIKYPHRNVSVNDIIEDIRRIAKELDKDTVTQDDYDMHGQFSHKNIYSKIGSWPKALEMAGLCISNTGRNISNEELFQNLERVWIKLGRQPKYGEMSKPLSNFHVSTYERRFSGWIKALECFVEYIQNDEKDVDFVECENLTKKRTSKSINLRLRFKVMMRDSFRCCKCGRSPATDSNISLQVDHILPWSKGGETIIENLQTLCSACNQGKSNLFTI